MWRLERKVTSPVGPPVGGHRGAGESADPSAPCADDLVWGTGICMCSNLKQGVQLSETQLCTNRSEVWVHLCLGGRV